MGIEGVVVIRRVEEKRKILASLPMKGGGIGKTKTMSALLFLKEGLIKRYQEKMSKIRQKWPDFSHFDAWSKAPAWAEYILNYLSVTSYIVFRQISRSQADGISFALYQGKEKRYATD